MTHGKAQINAERRAQMNYYISDLHIGHKNVIEFDGRPFTDENEMLEALVANWNARVRDKDTVYILGDFIWGKESGWADVVRRFRGKKVLVRGNHDPKTFTPETAARFAGIYDYLEITDAPYKVVLCHYPLLAYVHDFSAKGVMVYGHVHNTAEKELVQNFRRQVWARLEREENGPMGQLLHAGCMEEYMGYTPRTLAEIIAGDVEKYGNPVAKLG